MTDRVEQTYKQVSEQLQTELDAMTARVERLHMIWGGLPVVPHSECDEMLHEEFDNRYEAMRSVFSASDAASLSAIKADTLEEVAKFVEMQEGGCFYSKVMAAAIRGNLKYGDHFSFAAALREGKS